MKLNEKINLCRRRSGMSQEALAEQVGVSRQAVSKWECGDAIPEPAKLLQLARTFGVTTDWLLDDTLDMPEQQSFAQTLEAAPESARTFESEAQPTGQAQTLDATPPPVSYPHWVDSAPSVIARFLRKWGWLAGVYIMIIGMLFVGIGSAGRLMLGIFTHATIEQSVTIYPGGYPSTDRITIYDENGQVWENPPDDLLEAILGEAAGPSATLTPNYPDYSAARFEPGSLLYLVPNCIIAIGVVIMLIGLAVTIALRRVGRAERT